MPFLQRGKVPEKGAANVRVERVGSPTQDVRALVAELDMELSVEYPAENRHGLNLDRLFRPEVAFFVAYRGGIAAGCGGVAFDNNFAELKRMYVRPSARGMGVADVLLARLTDEARSSGFSRVVLETGDAQKAAMRFYQRNGFVKCQAFGAYTNMPPEAVLRSVFFEKRI